MQETSWPRRKGNLNQQSTQLKDHAKVHIECNSPLQFCAKAEVVLWVGSRELRGSQYKDSLQTKGFSIVLPLSWCWWTAHLFLWLGMMITVAYTLHHIVQQFCPTWGGLSSMDYGHTLRGVSRCMCSYSLVTKLAKNLVFTCKWMHIRNCPFSLRMLLQHDCLITETSNPLIYTL